MTNKEDRLLPVQQEIEKRMGEVLGLIGEDASREGLQKTP